MFELFKTMSYKEKVCLCRFNNHTFFRSKMKRSKSKTPSADTKNKRIPSGPRVDWVPPHPALGAQVNQKKKISVCI